VPTLRKPQFRRGAKHAGTASPKVMPAENEARLAGTMIKAVEMNFGGQAPGPSASQGIDITGT